MPVLLRFLKENGPPYICVYCLLYQNNRTFNIELDFYKFPRLRKPNYKVFVLQSIELIALCLLGRLGRAANVQEPEVWPLDATRYCELGDGL